MAKVLINFQTCQLEESDYPLIQELDRELSYNVQGAWFSPHFQKRKWDGKKRLLNSDLTFPVGLLNKVQKFYSDCDLELEVQDLRNKSVCDSIEILSQLKNLNKFPYDYQLQVLDQVKQHDRGIIRIGTGGGKSIIAALITALLGKTTIIYVVGKDLLYQFHQLFTDIFQMKIGIIGDGKCEISDINIVSIWTAGEVFGLKKNEILLEDDEAELSLNIENKKATKELLKLAKVHIFDECHLAACQTIQSIAKTISPDHIYGMSASPWRDDGADLLIESIFGQRIVDISASQLIKQGYLVQPIIKFAQVPMLDYSFKKSYPAVYKNYIVNNPIRNDMIIAGAAQMIEKGYKPLVLYEKLAHGKLLAEKLANFKLSLLSGQDTIEIRQQAGQDLKDNKIDIILASSIFNTGVDFPWINGLILADTAKGSVKIIQRVGRVIRKYPNKNFSVIMDFKDQIDYLDTHSKHRKTIYSSEEKFLIS